MSKVTVCVRFRPLNSREKTLSDGKPCIQVLDAESFLFKAEKEEEHAFCFDRVFSEESEQEEVYEFLAKPIIDGAINLINGTILIYGQTGAGKTYTMEGPSIYNCDENKKGLLPRVVDGLFKSIKSADTTDTYMVKLSMVEIYMEKLRDLFDLTKDNLQIKESKAQGIFLCGVTEITVSDTKEALSWLSRGISNRRVGETQMNMASSRSHCLYTFSIQKESAVHGRKFIVRCQSSICDISEVSKDGKLVLVDLAGSEKVEKTGAEGRVLDEAKNINKSLSALGNVINALTTGKVNHIPYRDSKLTRILQDALGGGTSSCALLCCCSPSFSNASESLSTLRFGTRSKLLKAPLPVITNAVVDEETSMTAFRESNNSCNKILRRLREDLSIKTVNLLEELFMLEGLLFEPQTAEDMQLACDDVINKTISSLEQAVKELRDENEKLRTENNILKSEYASGIELNGAKSRESSNYFDSFWNMLWNKIMRRPVLHSQLM